MALERNIGFLVATAEREGGGYMENGGETPDRTS